MQQELLIALFAGLGGMLGWGFADLFAKKTIDEIGDIVTLAWGHIFGTLALVAIALVRFGFNHEAISLPQDTLTWVLLVFFGVLQAVVYLLVYKGFGKGQVAVLNPVFASFSGFTALISILVFKEAINSYLVPGLVALFGGIILLSIDMNALRKKRVAFLRVPGFREVSIATVLAVVWTLFWDKFVGGTDWLSYTLFMYAFMTITIILIAWASQIRLSFKGSAAWKYLVLIGVCEILAYLAISIGYGKTHFTSVVALLSGAFSLPTIFLARVFLKERISRTQTIGGLVIILGIILLSLL
jgi:drug/metabolite transporter (DMT)-like permease